MSIRPLAPEVIAQIKSSTTITSLNGVIYELLKNSLEASSTKVDITVDYSRGSCIIEDDGLGILPSEFCEDGDLGKLYCEVMHTGNQNLFLRVIDSSKLTGQTPLHGGHGTFLASLSAVSLVSITSHHHLYHSHNTLTMHKSTVVSRQMPSSAQQYLTLSDHGTRVTVRDLFGNMPVRVKQRAISAEKLRGNSKEWDELRRNVISLLLAWPRSVGVAVREVGTSEKIVIRGRAGVSSSVSTDQIDIPAVCAILSQASLIAVDDKPFWVSTYASTQTIAISGAISLIASASKHVQFISFGTQPLVAQGTRSILHDEINRLFLDSAFGTHEEAGELEAVEIDRRAKDARYKGGRYTHKELKGRKQGVDRWPMFYINIQHNSKLTNGPLIGADKILDDKSRSLSDVVELLQAMIWEFLTKHHFRPKASRGRHSNRNPSTTNPKLEDLDASRLSGQYTPRIRSATHFEHIERKASASKSSLLQLKSLAVNEKLPSSRILSSKVDNPFDTWTRIKSGSKPKKFPILDNVQEISDEAANIRRPFSAPPCSERISSVSRMKNSLRSTTPLLSSSGKIIRRPFQDVTVPGVQSRTTSEVPLQSDQGSADTGDNIVAWINPATKIKSLVNQRTGLTVYTKNVNTGNSSSITSPLTTENFTGHQKLKGNKAPVTESPSPWLSSILKTWKNPVFYPTESLIHQVSFDGPEPSVQDILHGRNHHCSRINIDCAFKESSGSIGGRVSKEALSGAEVLSQVDNKFILVKLKAAKMSTTLDAEDGKMLVLIDQHAADERIRIEALLEQFFSSPALGTATPVASGVVTSLLDQPVTFEVSLKEAQILHQHKTYFTRWGIVFDLLSSIARSETASRNTAMQRIAVHSLPPSIIERCKTEPRLLIDLIRTEAWKIHDGEAKSVSAVEGDWLQCIHACPQGIIEMLNSRACRSAIMFNDELSKTQCEHLVNRLAMCKFPFQCAHGRPSLVPLLDIQRLDMRVAISVSDGHTEGGTFGTDFKKWRYSIK